MIKANSKKKFISKNSGITLVALVITIIALGILIGVSIKVVYDHGIIDETEEIGSSHDYRQAREKLIMNLEKLKLQSVRNKIRNKEDRIKTLKDIDGKSNIEVNLVGEEVNIETYKGIKPAVKVKVDKFEFWIDGNLNIIEEEGVTEDDTNTGAEDTETEVVPDPTISEVEWVQNEYGEFDYAYVEVSVSDEYSLELTDYNSTTDTYGTWELLTDDKTSYRVGTKSEHDGFQVAVGEIVAVRATDGTRDSNIVTKRLSENTSPTITSVKQIIEKTKTTEATLKVVASDADSGIDNIEVYDQIAGNFTSTYKAVGEGTYEVTIKDLNPDTIYTAPGIRVIDACHNEQTYESFTIETEKEVPSAPIIEVVDNNSTGDFTYDETKWYNSNNDLEINLSVEGVGAGGVTYQYKTDESIWFNGTIKDNGDNTAYLWSVPQYEGTLYFKAIDSAGTESEISSINIKYDKTLPTVAISLSGSEIETGIYNSDVYVTFTAIDEIISGIKEMRYSIKETGAGESITSGDTIELTEAGSYTITLIATDEAGNENTLTKTITIDRGVDYSELTVGDYVNYPVYYYNLATWDDDVDTVSRTDSLMPADEYNGWRILSIEGEGENAYVRLITAGVPLNYYHAEHAYSTVPSLTTRFFNNDISSGGNLIGTFSGCGFMTEKENGTVITDITNLRSLFTNKFTATYASGESATYTDSYFGTTFTNSEVAGYPKVQSMTKADVDKVWGSTTSLDTDVSSNDLLAIPCEDNESSGEYAVTWLADAHSNNYMWSVDLGGVIGRGKSDYTVHGVRPVVTLKAKVQFTPAEVNINDTQTLDISIEVEDETVPTISDLTATCNGSDAINVTATVQDTESGLSSVTIQARKSGEENWTDIKNYSLNGQTTLNIIYDYYTERTYGTTYEFRVVATDSATETPNTSTSEIVSCYSGLTVGDYVNYPVYYDNVETNVQDNGLTNGYTPADEYNGWRILSIEGEGENSYVRLVSAGVPLTYRHTASAVTSVENLTAQFFDTTISNDDDAFYTCGFKTAKENGTAITDINSLRNLFANEFTATYTGGTPKVQSMTKADLDKVWGSTTDTGTYLTSNNLLAIPVENASYRAIYWFATTDEYGGIWYVNSQGQTFSSEAGFRYTKGVRPVVTLKAKVQFTPAASNTNNTQTWDISM